jgi:ribosomal protein S18 acetylase RimI-like enzyme
MNVRLLSRDEVNTLEPIFSVEFEHDGLPRETEADVVGVFDGSDLAGFLVVERLFHIAQVYVAPEYRRRRAASEMAAYVEQSIPEGRSAITITQTPEGGRMAESWGFVKIPGQLYRRAK